MKLSIVAQNQAFVFVLAVAKILLTLFVVLRWLNDYYEITPHRILHKKGLIWRKEEVFEITHIRSFGIQQGVLGKFFNYGTPHFFDWRLQKNFYIYLIHNPQKYLHILEELLPRVDEEKDILRERLRDKE